jgi:hypothetical protein
MSSTASEMPTQSCAAVAATAPLAPNLARDLVLPTLLFMALGGMTWAVRGSSGFGAANGCVFAGVTWGAAWWFIARDPSGTQSRRYSSGWIVLALTVGVGISGDRGWMQWPSFFEGHLQLDSAHARFAPISKAYGFLWLFIAGMPWAGLGACLLAWCASKTRLRAVDWVARLSCGVGGAVLAKILFEAFPDVFLPLHKQLAAEYANLENNPNLRRLISDNSAAMLHLGLYFGFLAYETLRRDWKNVILISTVGVLNGLGWALCQNWRWAAHVWPQANFNWWRCWESCGGLSIGAAYGVAYYFVNRPAPVPKSESMSLLSERSSPLLEQFALYGGLLLGLGLSLKNGLKGWANIYLGKEDYWDRVLWSIFGPVLLLSFIGLAILLQHRPSIRGRNGDLFPKDYALLWLVLILQNGIAQLVTGPATVWNEMAFKIYYLLLMIVSAVIVHHFYTLRRFRNGPETAD